MESEEYEKMCFQLHLMKWNETIRCLKSLFPGFDDNQYVVSCMHLMNIAGGLSFERSVAVSVVQSFATGTSGATDGTSGATGTSGGMGNVDGDRTVIVSGNDGSNEEHVLPMASDIVVKHTFQKKPRRRPPTNPSIVRPTSPYNQFKKQTYNELKSTNGELDKTEMRILVNERWKTMSTSEKATYASTSSPT